MTVRGRAQRSDACCCCPLSLRAHAHPFSPAAAPPSTHPCQRRTPQATGTPAAATDGSAAAAAIPVVDLSAGDAAAAAATLRTACAGPGFFLLSGHGVPPAVVDRMFDQIRALFDLPLADKMALLQVRVCGSGRSRGRGGCLATCCVHLQRSQAAAAHSALCWLGFTPR